MINTYVRYRNWYFEHQAPHEWPLRPQEAFKQHINAMTQYELLETLAGFGNYGEDDDA